MAENEPNQQQQFTVQRIYTKDISFESPNAPQAFVEKWEPPAVNIELNTQATPLSDGFFEVVLTVTVNAKHQEKNVYLAEVQQAGIFNISGFAEKDQGWMLYSYCPNILFPYARETISSLVSKGTFPQLVLAPVNFDALYADHLRKEQAAEGQGEGGQEDPVH